MKGLRVVLIVDDTPDYLRSLAMALRGRFEAVTAQSAEEALAMVEAPGASEPDAALVDICLDEGRRDDRGGLAVASGLRARFPSLPIIAMSALSDPDLPAQARAAGADEFLSKPISVAALIDRLEQALGRPRA